MHSGPVRFLVKYSTALIQYERLMSEEVLFCLTGSPLCNIEGGYKALRHFMKFIKHCQFLIKCIPNYIWFGGLV